MNVQNVETRNFDILGESFEIIVFKDADELSQTFFRVKKNGIIFPLKVIGGHLSYITFSVSDEVEQDASNAGHGSPLMALFEEAKRMIEATINAGNNG